MHPMHTVRGPFMLALVLSVWLSAVTRGRADEPPATGLKSGSATAAAKPLSFMRDVAPILVRNCIACHNPKKTEGKYVMTTFAQLAKGGKQGEGITLVPGQPDESYLIDLIQPDSEPRMPYKLDP